MAQPTISIRALDSNHDPMYGSGQANFLVDIDAVAQIIQTSLLLFQGEWWADLSEGLPLFQSILGGNNGKQANAIILLIQNVILGVPYVLSIQNINTSFTTNRVFTFSCEVVTQFGTVTVSFQPGSSAVLPT